MYKKTIFKQISLLLLVVFFASSSIIGKETKLVLKEKIEALNSMGIIKISDIKQIPVDTLMKNAFKEKYVLFVEQPIDHSNLSVGTFKQRVIVALSDFNQPTVLTTEGYGAGYALSPRYREEISSFFNTNIVFVEHRYFLESTPFIQNDSSITDETLNWDYMNATNAAADLHKICSAFKTIFTKKWLATGISKGGQTAMFYRAFYPNDVDVTVPYVGPLCKSTEDGRHEPFLAKYVGTANDRAKIEAFQIEFLKRRDKIKPMFDDFSKKMGYTYQIPMDAVYDYCVLEFPFAFWQWGRSSSSIPDLSKASDKEMFNYMLKVSGPDYFAQGQATAPFFVQAAGELGYYGYNTKAFKGLLTIKSTKGYLNRLFVPQNREFKFNNYLYKKVLKFLSKTDAKMMFIYGQWDPWSAVIPIAPVKNEKLRAKGKGRSTMKLYIAPGGSHSSRISTLPAKDKEEAINILKNWLF